jgi:hypothetical protein
MMQLNGCDPTPATVWGGNKPNATFPAGFEGLAGHTTGTHQFVGFETTNIVLGRVVPTFPNAKKALITGSSAGGMSLAYVVTVFVVTAHVAFSKSPDVEAEPVALLTPPPPPPPPPAKKDDEPKSLGPLSSATE